MRGWFFLIPAVLMAQTTPPKSPATAPKAAPGATKSGAPAGTAAAKKAAPPAGIMTEDQRTIYALGVLMYQKTLAPFALTPAELELVKKAMSDTAAGKPAVDGDTMMARVNALRSNRATVIAEKEKVVSREYLAKCAAEPGAVKTASGLVYRDIKVGTGASPKPTDSVTVHYRGTLINGTEFDSSYKRNQPTPFVLNQVIPCWTEGVQKMKVGGKARLVCPSSIAYGDQGQASIPAGATLIFEIELLNINGH